MIAVASGYLTKSIIYHSVLTFETVRMLDPVSELPAAGVWELEILAVAAISSAAGGLVAAAIARPPRFKDPLILASLFVIVGLMSIYEVWGKELLLPWWFVYGEPVIQGFFAAFAGWLVAGRPSWTSFRAGQ